MASNNSGKPSTNASGTSIFSSLKSAAEVATTAVKGATTAVTTAVTNVLPIKNNNQRVNPAQNTLKFKNPGGQTGGTARLNYQYSSGQPSDKVMDWATTAGIPFQKGGKRRTYRGGKRVKRRTLKRGHKRSHKHNK
jgi:hypothetical protein